MTSILMKEYSLRYKDEIVFKFRPDIKYFRLINKNLLPISISNDTPCYDMVTKFCASRTLMMNREYCKEILVACGVEDQNYVNICIVSKALSFRDNYWMTESKSKETWSNVNLYRNKFSIPIEKVALTGELGNNTVDKIYTGELTNKGTRAKCYSREQNGIYLYKNETNTEIASEIISYYIATALRLPASKYWEAYKFNRHCSVCKIDTSEVYELIPCRDIMEHYNENTMSITGYTYNMFMQCDTVNFIKMHLFDYVTLNVGRNRDNFGILRANSIINGLYPIYDHDSCFKGKGTNAIYFPTGKTFAQTLNFLKEQYNIVYNQLKPDIHNFKVIIASEEFKITFLKYKTKEEYNEMLKRADNL